MILQRGLVIRKNEDSKMEEAFEMRFVNKHELDLVLELQALIYDGITRKEIFVRDTYEELINALDHNGRIFGVFNERNHLISYRFISFPGVSSSNMGRDIGLSKESLDKVVHLETTVVHPDYRGNKLQSITLKEALRYIDKKNHHHLICTVSPYNPHSLKNIMEAGLQIKALKQKYGSHGDPGVWRFILHKNTLEDPIAVPEGGILFNLEDLKPQKYLIEKGFIGYKLKTDNKIVHYTKMMQKTSSNSFENATFVS